MPPFHLTLPRKLLTTPLSKPYTSQPIKNRLYDPIRSTDQFSTLLLLSASAQRPLLTLWTASYCASCRAVLPLVQEGIEHEGWGEREGGVGFAEVEMDAVGMGGLAGEYLITSIPTLLSFTRQEAQLATKTTSVSDMKNPGYLRVWVENEARRGGKGGGGGGWGWGWGGRGG